jgi:branched-chain amino acid transport system ATP-binding protein
VPLLELRDCTVRFGGLAAVDGVSLAVEPGELLSIIGPNGAGKTTLFNLITGAYAPTSGEIRFAGSPLAGLPPYRVAQRGIARTFQNTRLFKQLSVLDNVRAATCGRARVGLTQCFLPSARVDAEEKRLADECRELLRLFGLLDRARVPASSLPYGDQRRLEIVRALATRPKLLLLDEPSAGMNAGETLALMSLIQRIQSEFALTILLIEHDMRVVMGLSPRIIVLDYGKQIAEGSPAEIRHDPRVIEAYLGESE